MFKLKILLDVQVIKRMTVSHLGPSNTVNI